MIAEKDPRIIYKALPCVVRLTKEEENVDTRILAAETLAFLIELSAELQWIAAISNHLIKTISSFLWWEPDVSDIPSYAVNAAAAAAAAHMQTSGAEHEVKLSGKSSSSGASGTGTSVSDHLSGLTKFQMLQLTRKLDVQSNHSRDMKKAAFRVFAALAANDEDLRKRIMDTDRLMTGIVTALNSSVSSVSSGNPDASGNAKLQMAAVSCL